MNAQQRRLERRAFVHKKRLQQSRCKHVYMKIWYIGKPAAGRYVTATAGDACFYCGFKKVK